MILYKTNIFWEYFSLKVQLSLFWNIVYTDFFRKTGLSSKITQRKKKRKNQQIIRIDRITDNNQRKKKETHIHISIIIIPMRLFGYLSVYMCVCR